MKLFVKSRLVCITASIILLVMSCVVPVDSGFPGGLPILRASVSADETEGNSDSMSVSISADGRYVAFHSLASNLVSGDGDGLFDVFVFDRQENTLELASKSSAGIKGNGNGESPSISQDGRYVAFQSTASNLVAVDSNSAYDIFVFDRMDKTIELVSVNNAGDQGNAGSYGPSISADGRYVAFYSTADNLVADDVNGATDIFVFDRQNAVLVLASVSTAGIRADDNSLNPVISHDGRYVAFRSYADNITTGDSNNYSDIFVFDRQNQTTEIASVADDNTQANNHCFAPSISNNGRFVAFHTNANSLVPGDTGIYSDIFVRDRQNSTIQRVSVNNIGTQGNGFSEYPSISADGRYVAFSSTAINLVTGDANNTGDIFVHDRQTNTTVLVSLSSDGTQSDAYCSVPRISADGRYTAFETLATTLVPGDANACTDIYVAPVR